MASAVVEAEDGKVLAGYGVADPMMPRVALWQNRQSSQRFF